MALMSIAYNLFVPKSFVWGDFFAKGGNADLDLNRNYTADLSAPHSIIGSPISLLIWSPQPPVDVYPDRSRVKALSIILNNSTDSVAMFYEKNTGGTRLGMPGKRSLNW